VGMNTDELTEYLYQKHALSPLLIDETRDIIWEEIERKARRQSILGDIETIDVTRVRVSLPMKPGLKLDESLRYPANTGYTIGEYEFDLDEINYTVSFEDAPENVERALDNYKSIFAQRNFYIHS